MKTTVIAKSYHGREFFDLFQRSWANKNLLICVPPKHDDYSFTAKLPARRIEWYGFSDQAIPEILPSTMCESDYVDQPVLGVFTSGTTGPGTKLVLFSEKNILSCQEGILDFFKRDQIKTVFCYPQPYHVFGLLLGYAMATVQKWNLIIPSGKYSSEHHELRLAQGGEQLLTLGTPTHFRDLAQYLVSNPSRPIAPSYSCIIGGAKVSREDWDVARNSLRIEAPSIGYGCTEASPGIAHLPPGVPPKEDGMLGIPLKHLTLEILADRRLKVRGDSICLATIQNQILEFPESLTVNDAVRVDAGGMMVFEARADLTINRGGEKFSCEHFEKLLKDQFEIDALCVPVADSRLGEDMGMLLKVSPASLTIPRQIIYETLEDNFGRKFNQNLCQMIDQFPTSDQAKVDRRAAVKLFQ
jgi:acyl-CoA synthetase (AMP-forming)/AMP-acid ligase II